MELVVVVVMVEVAVDAEVDVETEKLCSMYSCSTVSRPSRDSNG